MKKLIVFILVVMGLTFSCNTDQDNIVKDKSNLDEMQLRNSNPDFIPFNIPFPEGTSFEIVGNMLKFTLPQPYYIVGIDDEGTYFRSGEGGSGTITCECTSGTGCDPIKSKEGVGCLMKDGCRSCNKTKSRIIGIDKDLVDITIFQPESNLFITNFNQLNNHYLLPKEFLGYSEIDSILSNILINQEELPESEKETVFIDVHGYILLIELKMNGDNVSIKAGGGDDGSKDGCECKVAGHDCPLESHWTGTKWCNSNDCSKCTMHFSIKNSDDITKVFTTDEGGLISID